MLDKIPLQRLIIGVLCIGLLPFFIVLLNFMSKQAGVDDLQSALTSVQEEAFIREKKQSVNMAVRNHYREADHFYIDKFLETITFLEPEVESLQKILSNTNYAEDEEAKKRLEFLTGSANSMSFVEGVVQTSPLFQETTETLAHLVEINITDLQHILTRIEGVEMGSYRTPQYRPQLIVLDFKLDKKELSGKNEVFMLNLKLLKREFL